MPAVSASKYLVTCTWDDVPHLDDDAKAKLWESIPVYQRDARSKGVPMLGAGAIYPVAEDDIRCEPFDIPEYFPRAYALDVGWNRTAALWMCWDRERDIVYIYDEYYRGQAEPASHAAAIRMRGEWIPGCIDPAARGRNQKDGTQLMAEYVKLGLSLVTADNAVEAGIHRVFQRMTTGRLKIFSTLQNLWSELRIYRRDEHGKIVKENDHLCDCLRYGVASGLAISSTKPYDEGEDDYRTYGRDGRSAVGGY